MFSRRDMNIIIRQEETIDYESVFSLIEEAFRSLEKSDHREQFLVEKLRKSDAFIPELSLIAEIDEKIVGHILLTKIKIINGDKSQESLALAPMSVLPEFQRMGVGEKLIKQAHQKAKYLGYKSVVVLGHPDYYPKFGYQLAKNYGIELPFEVEENSCLVIELIEDGLKDVSGKVEYAKEFYE